MSEFILFSKLSGVFGKIFGGVISWRKEKRDAAHFETKQRKGKIAAMEQLRHNLKYRVGLEGDSGQNEVRDAWKTAEAILTQMYADEALADPIVRSYFDENLRKLIPREITPADQVPEQVRETAALVEAALEIAGAMPSDAQGHFLRGNALCLSSERLEGKAITKALRDAIEAYGQALEVYTREARPQDWAATPNNKGIVLRNLGDRLEGKASAQALQDAIEAYDQALEVHTREALPQLLATSKSGTLWKPRDQVLDGGLLSSLRALL